MLATYLHSSQYACENFITGNTDAYDFASIFKSQTSSGRVVKLEDFDFEHRFYNPELV